MKKVLEYNSNIYIKENNDENLRYLNEIKNNIEDKINKLKRKISSSKSVILIEQKPLVKLNYNKFNSLKKRSFLNLIDFQSPVELCSLYNSNKNIRYKILNILRELCGDIIANFNSTYLRKIRSNKNENMICINTIKKKEGNTISIYLTIKGTIMSNDLLSNCISIGFKSKFPCDSESYNNIIRFDVKNPGPLSFWIMREYTTVK